MSVTAGMNVVSDTTAITTLLKAGQVRLLQDMFDHVSVPQAVWDELESSHTTLPTSDLVISEALRMAGEA